MQTRRDQLQAYRFQNRRALAALVTGEPNVLEPPMRRLTVTTISGIMIAVLVTVGFTLFGFIRPSAGDEWKKPGTIVVEEGTGATYVVIGTVLEPTINYTSALIAAGNSDKADPVEVDRSDLGDFERGKRPIGIPGLPVSPPSSGDLVSSPVTICSRQSSSPGSDDVSLRVAMSIGLPGRSRPLGADAGVVVVDGRGNQFLLASGRRYAVTDQRVATALGFQVPPVQVGTALVNAVPRGPDLAEPSLPQAGRPSSVQLDNRTLAVGQLLDESSSESFVVLPDGIAPVDRVQRALLLTVRAGGAGLDPRTISRGTAINLKKSNAFDRTLGEQFDGLPASVPAYDRTAADTGGLCAIYRSGSNGMAQTPVFAVPPGQLAAGGSAGSGTVTEGGGSRSGHADSVSLPPGRAALVKSADGARTTFLVSDSGLRFAAGGDNAGADVLASLGYGEVTPAQLPAQVLRLIPTGSVMDPNAARTPVS